MRDSSDNTDDVLGFTPDVAYIPSSRTPLEKVASSSDVSDEDLTRPFEAPSSRTNHPRERTVDLKQMQRVLHARDGLYDENTLDAFSANASSSSSFTRASSVVLDSGSDGDMSTEEEAVPISVEANRQNIPELHRAAKEAYIAASGDARVSRLAFAAAAPPSEDKRSFMQEDDDNVLSVKVDYCIFCYHGLHILHHEVSEGLEAFCNIALLLCKS